MDPYQKILDAAFSRASKKASAVKRVKPKTEYAKRKEIARVKEAGNQLEKRLYKQYKALPRIVDLPSLHRKIIDITFGEVEVKKVTSHLKESKKIIRSLCKKYLREVAKAKDMTGMHKKRNEFYARASSVMKKLGKTIPKINSLHKIIKELPAIRPDLKTIILAGYPNTGKTTILKALTGSSPEIKPYPFTTKKVKIGAYWKGPEQIQVLDTPGLLDRPDKERNPIERQAIEVIKGLKGVKVFVLDPTKSCGYTLEEQASLYKELKREYEDLELVVNKKDLASKEELDAVQGLKPGAVFSAEKNPAQARKALEKLLRK